MPHHRYKLPDLPYGYNALVPTISEEIMRLHHDKHLRPPDDEAEKTLDKQALNDLAEFRELYRP